MHVSLFKNTRLVAPTLVHISIVCALCIRSHYTEIMCVVIYHRFCDGFHWHVIALIGPDKTAYYWEPFGRPLSLRDDIATAFTKYAPSDWHLESIRLHFQPSDNSYDCGVWVHYFRTRAFAYAVSRLCGCGSPSFPTFMLETESVAGRPPPPVDLRGVPPARKRTASARNNAFSRRIRDDLRVLLQFASVTSNEELAGARLPGFIAEGSTPPEVIDLDEELEGDNEYNPIVAF